jgi:hypothetical protein
MVENVIRVAVIKPSAKADDAAIALLDEILANLSDDLRGIEARG